MARMGWQWDDGGRQAAGRRGTTGDCVCRAIAIAARLPYEEAYASLANGMASQRGGKGVASASHGINVTRRWFKNYMGRLGFVWHPCMGIGTGCRVHLAAGELPGGRLVVALSRHYTAVVDGTIHDIYDPQREGTWTCEPDRGQILRPGQTRNVNGVWTQGGGRCVYGYWSLEERPNANNT